KSIYGCFSLSELKSNLLFVFRANLPLPSPFSSFPQDPFADIGRATDHLGSCQFAHTQKPDDVRVHDCYLAQIENCGFRRRLDLSLYFVEMFCSDSADQPDDCAFPVRLPFNLQRFWLLSK